MADPAISVVMPVYNEAEYLSASIESILAQSFGDFEFLILDDGSTDSTPDILQHYAQKDDRIKIFQRENRGPTASYIELANMAQGTFIARQDGDDVSHPERFERKIAYLEKNPSVALIGCYSYEMDKDGNIFGIIGQESDPKIIKKLYPNHMLFLGSVFIVRRSAYVAVGGYRKGFIYSQDFDLTSRIIEKYNGANIETPLFYRRYKSQGISIQKESLQLQLHLAGLVCLFNHERLQYGRDSYSDNLMPENFHNLIKHKNLIHWYYLYQFYYHLGKKQFKKACLALLNAGPKGFLVGEVYTFPPRKIWRNLKKRRFLRNL